MTINDTVVKTIQLDLTNFGHQKASKHNLFSIISVNLLLLFISCIPVVVNAQNLLTTPDSLYNYQTDNPENKGVSVSISEDGNVIVKGSPFADNGRGAVTLYLRDPYTRTWASSQLSIPNDYKQPYYSWAVQPVEAGKNNFGGPSRKNLLGNINSAFGVGNSVVNAGISGIATTAAYINGELPNDNINFGSSVAISADGSTIVVGAKNTENGNGAFWVYKNSNASPKNYSQYKSILYPLDFNGKAAIGTSVAVSGDGSRIVVGGPNDNLKVSIFESCDGTMNVPLINQTITLPFASGKVPIWVVSKTIDHLFEKMVEKISSITDEIDDPILGPLVKYAIERFFETVIKPPLYNWMNNELKVETEEYERKKVGAAWVFKLNADGDYEQEGDKLQNKGRDGLLPPILIENSNFGPAQTTLDSINGSQTSINSILARINQITTAMDPINDLFAFSGLSPLPSIDIPPYVGTRDVNIDPVSGSPFFNELTDLKNATNSRLFKNAFQGMSVSISKDGSKVMMGAPGLIGGKGVTYIYKNQSEKWYGEDVIVGDNTGGLAQFGSCVNISQDGLMSVVGAPNTANGDTIIGAFWVYKKNQTTNRWDKALSKGIPNDLTIASGNKTINVGSTVAISSDNDDIIIGAPGDNNNKGAMWLYKPISGTWTKQQKISPSYSNGKFGSAVAIGEYGLTAVVGIPNFSSGGSAYVYNSCEPPKPILSQYADTICSGYQFNKYYQYVKRRNTATSWVWRVGSENGSVFSPGSGESSSNDSLIKKTLNSTTTYFVRGEGGCVNGRSVSITTVVKPTPVITSVTPTYVCLPGGQVTLQATANSGTIKWIGWTWDGIRWGLYDNLLYNSTTTAPYNYYSRDPDPKKSAYGSGKIEASGNTYKPTISNSRNYVISSLLNGCWSDTSSVNARIERPVTKTGDSYETLICDDFTNPLNVVITAPDISTVRWQQINSILDPQIPTQLPITYNFYDNANNDNVLIQSSTSNQLTHNLVRAVPSNLTRYYSYSLSNACGVSAPVSVTVRLDGKGALMQGYIENDTATICPNTSAVFNLENKLVTSRNGFQSNFSFRIYDSLTGGNFIDTIQPVFSNATNETQKSIFRSVNALSASRNYYVSVRNSCGESPRKTLPVIVDALAPPKVYNIKTADVCGSGSVLLSAESNEGNILWYNSPNVAVGPLANNTLYAGQYQTPNLTTTTNYWVSTTGAKCYNSQRILVQAPVWEQPTLTVSTTAYNTCVAGDEAVLTASTDWGVINWYTTSSGGTPFWTGSSVRVYPTTTTTYYVEADHYCKSARIAITVTVNDNLQITQTIPGSRVNAGVVILGATSSIGTPVWTATNGSVLGTGNSFTTNSITSNTTYYVAATANGCTSVRVPVLATVNYVPIVNTTMNASRCGAGSVTLSASAEVGTIRWFDANNNQVGTGNTFTTPSLNTTTTYYAQSWYLNVNSNYDVSARIPVKAFINAITTPTITYSGGCVGQQPKVNISLPQLSVKYSLRYGTTVLDSKFANGINNNFDLNAPAISVSTTYNVYAEKYDSLTALNFDGYNDYVEVLNHGGFNPNTQLMLGAWVNRDDIQKTNVIISKGSFSSNNGYSLSILNDYKLTFDIGSQRFQTTATISANTWTHVAASYDGNTVKLYINGTLSGSFTSVGSIPNNQGNLIIGSAQDYKGDANYGFSGKIDEVAIFCGVNFNTPIADMMNGKLVGNEYGLIAYYNFEHGAGITNLTDIAANLGAKNGVLNNMDSVNAWVSGAPINYCSAQISSSTINPVSVPSIVNTISPSRVGPGSLTVTAVASAGATTKWYSDSTLTTNVFTGNNYVLPVLNYTTKFYAVANNGCNSTKVGVVATINDYPEEQQINCISAASDVNFFDNISLGYSPTAMVRMGQYLFIGNGDGIINVYTAGSGSLTFISSLKVSNGNGDIYHLAAANGYLYASQRYENKIYVIDYSDVSALKILGQSISYYNNPTSFVVDGSYVYVGSRDDQKLYITYSGIPASNNMPNFASIALGEAVYCVQKKDNIVYVGVNNTGIKLVNISNPYSPYVSKTLSISGTYTNNFYIKGNYLYVSPTLTYNPTSYNTVLKVYDISDASNPIFVRDVSLPDGYAVAYTADSKYLYLTTYSQTTGARKMHILDITTPSNPVIVVTNNSGGSDANGIAARLGHIYTINGQGINDFAVTTAPSISSTKSASRYGTGTVVLTATSTGGTINWYTASSGGSVIGTGANFTTPTISSNTTYYVGATDGTCASARIPATATIIEVPPCIASSSDLGTPSFTGTLDVKSMYRSGNYLYFIGGSWIYVYNISSGSPVLTSTYDVGGPGAINDIKVVNNYLYAVTRYTEKLYIVDISNPASLQPVGSTSSIFNIPTGIWVEGNFAYVNNSDNHSLDVINIANPSSPSRVGQLTGLGDPAKGIQKKGNILYLANWTYGFTVVDVSNPTAPTLVQQISSKESGDPTGAYNLYIIGNYLYVASDAQSNPRVRIYDITNPAAPVHISTLTPPKNVLSFDYDGIYLYCGMRKYDSNGDNIVVYKMTNLASPTLVATANTLHSSINSIYSTSVVGIAATSIGGNGKIFAAGTSFGGNNYVVTFPVNNSSTITSVTSNSRCGTGSVNLQATANGGTTTWYSDSAGTTAIGTGSSFNTPSIATNTTYYVAAVINGCTLPTIPVFATVNPMPVITGTTGATRRDTGTVNLQATANTGLLKWYNVASGGSALDYGSSFTSPVVNNTTTFYVESQGELCTSTRVPVVATVITTPLIRTVTNGSRCLAGTVTLNATASVGTINWYDSYSSSTSLGTGNSFTTPSLSATRYYYVSTTNNGETSARIVVAAYIGKLAANANAGADITNFCGNNVTLSADSINGSFGLWTVISGVADIDTATSLKPKISGIAGSINLQWRVSSPFCPDKIDTLKIIVAKPKPIFYTDGYSCINGSQRLQKYNANNDSITTIKEFWSTPDIKSLYGSMIVAANGKMYGLTEQGGANNQGAIFEFDPRTNNVKILYNFSSTSGNGFASQSVLVESSPGVLVGLAANGGANNRGTIYRFNYNTGQFTVIRHQSTAEGYSYAESIVKNGSKLYLLARNGGVNNSGAIVEIDTATYSFVVKYNFVNSYANRIYGNMVIAADGNLYSANYDGGANGLGELFQYNFTTNALTVKYTITNASMGSYIGNIFLASNNKIYWITPQNSGGVNNNGTIVEYDPATNIATKKFDFNNATNVGGRGTFIQASDGYLYAVSSVGGLNSTGGLFRFNPITGSFEVVKYNPVCASATGSLYASLTEYPISNADAGVDSTICGNTYNLTALPASYGTGTWTVVKGSASIASVNNANSSVTLNSDTAVLRWTISDGLCYSSFDEVQIIRKTLPVITASGLQSCTPVNGNYTLTAVAAGATLNWYADSTGTAILTTGATCNIASSSTSAKVYVAATANGCTSARTPVVISLPIITSTTPGVRCSAGSLTLQATANVGSIKWYTTATGGSSLATGNSFTTPTVTGTTTYYAEASQNGCASARVAVTATVTDNYNVNVNPVVYSFSLLHNGQTDLSNCPSSAPRIYTTSLADNDLTTGAGTVNYTGESWIQAKFAAPSTVTNVIVAGGSVCAYFNPIAGYLNGSLLQSSTDGVNWTTRATVSGATDNATTTINVGSVTAQYWRLYKSGNNYVAATEFSFSPMPTAVSPLMANAGPDQNSCSSTFTVSGNTPTQGSGLWSVVSGKATITNPTSPTTTVTNVYGTAILRWSFNSANCGVSFDDIALTASVKPILFGVTDNYIYTYNAANNAINTQTQNTANSTIFKGSNNKMYLLSYSGGAYNQGILNEYLPNKKAVSQIKSMYGTNSSLFEDNGVIYMAGQYAHYTYNISTNTYNQTRPIYDGITGVVSPRPAFKVGNMLYGVAYNQNSGLFVIYSYNITTYQSTLRYTFSSGTGDGSLVLGTNGKMYGISSQGGNNNKGFIYEYDTTTNSVTTRIHFSNFNAGTDATRGKMLLASNNKLYGTCNSEGGGNAGTIWEYDYLNNSFSVRFNFTNSSTTGGNPNSGFELMQASDGKIYGVTQNGGSSSQGMIYSFDYTASSLSFLQSLTFGENSVRGRLVEYNTLIADAGPDQTICSSTATMAANTSFAGTGTWSVVAGTATIASPNSPTTTVTGLKGTTILRWTITTGACSTSYDDVVINAQGIITVTDGRRCGTGAGTVTLNATASNGMNVNWYTAPTTSTSTNGNAIDFNGSNQSISIPNNTAYNFTDKYTFESWVNIKSYQYGTFVSKFDDDNNNRSWMIGMGETGDYTKITVVQTQLGTWTNPIQWNTGFTPSLNTWYHIAVVYDGTLASNNIKLYVNGVLTSQTNWAYTLTPNTANLYLGGYDGAGNGLNAGANSRYINAKMDEVRLWNTARTATEVSNNYTTSVQSNSSGLVAYFKLDETSGTVVTDASGNNNSGTLVNSPSRLASTLITETILTQGTLLGTGNNFTTPSISANTTYYAQASGNGCTSAYTPVVATIAAAVATPTITASGSTNICNGNSVSLSVPSALMPFTKFATSVKSFSSQYNNSSFSASQILGAPDYFPSYGSTGNIWVPSSPNGTREFIVLGFDNPQPINLISIYETYNPGYIDTVYVKNPNTGLFEIVYSGTAAAAPAVARINKISFPMTAYPVSEIRIAINNLLNDFKEIDAVSIGNNNQYSFLWSPNGETTTSINASTAGSYSVTLTDNNGCSATSVPITVTVDTNGIVAKAGADQVNCSGSFTMAANSTGTWSVVSGAATITNATSPTTAVTVTTSPAVLRWTINNAGCGTTTDDVVLTKTSSAPILLYPTTNEPNCTYCDVGAINLFDGNRNEVISKKGLNVSTNNSNTPSGLDYFYRASDGVLYGIANSYLYNNNTQTDYTSNLFYYDPITNKPISITNLTTSNYLRNITEYNGQLYIVMARANTISRIYIVNMSSKQATILSFPGNVSSGHAPCSGLTVVGNKMYGTTNDGIYEFNPANNTFTWKYYYSSASLGGNNSDNAGELVLAANGKLYGKTIGGGANGYGTLYEYDVVNNTATARVNFATSSTGSRSIRSAVLVSNNLIYGTCHEGGTNTRGTLWEYNTSTNTFTVKYHFTLVNGTSNQLMQASNGKIYGVCSGPAGSGQIYSFDISTNSFNILKTYYNSSNGGTGIAGPLVEEKFVANAGEDMITCSSTATMVAIPNLASAGASKWTVVSGVATIANADSANTTVTNLAGANTLRYTTNYGACSSSFDDITIYAKPAVPTVTNGSRCGTGAGTVSLGATTNSGTGVVKWYADSVGGSSLATGTSFTTPSISSTTTYYAEVADGYASKNVTYSYSSRTQQCYSSSADLNDNNFTTGVFTSWGINPEFIKASFDSSFTVNSIYLAAGILCDGQNIEGYNNYYGSPAIYYSNDNVNWTYVMVAGGMTNNNGKQQYYIGGITARYWRLQNANNPIYSVAVSEFSFDFTTNFSCASNRVPVTAYIGTTPTITSTTNGSGCSTATLQATASAGTVKWYAAATGTDTALATGNSFTTPTLTNNTTYYVSASNTGCESSRTPVIATINVPSITCAVDMVVSNTNNQCGATVTVTAPTISNACGGAAPTLTNNFNNTANASGNYPIGITSVVWTATNANGNTATCTQLVTVNDNQSPNTVCRNKSIYLDASGAATITAADINNGSNDNCGINTMVASITSFDCTNLGANQVLLIVTDINGNEAACASTVTVLDTIKPAITAPANISVNSANGQCGATVSFSATASDNCSVASLTYSTASGSLFTVGSTLVTATATDASGNTSSATFTVTVADNQNPVITCPANITVSCSASTDTANTGRATATDNCGIQSIAYNDVSTKSNNASLCTFYSYTITRTWAATDVNGRTSSCVQTITVVDNVKPVIADTGSNLSLECNPTNAAIEAALGSATATDNCSTMGTPTATDGSVIVNGILRSQTRSFNISDICGNAATTVTRTATWTVLSPASVSIAASANNICSGASVICTATPSNGGISPAYQWSKNSVEINGATSDTYNYVPANGDVIGCAMTATNACETGVVVNSNNVTMIVRASTSSTTNTSICQSALPYSWNGLTFNAAGSQTKTGLTNSIGCDSSATLNLTVNFSTSTSNISICSSELPYSWNGLTFTAAGTQTKTGLTNATGCDSSATLNLTVIATTSSTQSIAICPSELPYSWNGLTFSATSSQTAHFTNAAGCDSSATLNLSVKLISTSTTDLIVCVSSLPYSWNGLTFNATGSQTAHLTNEVGCDSAATLNLTVVAVGTWTGALSTNYNSGSNWCGGVPPTNANVVIKSTQNDPVLSGNLIVNNITLDDTLVLGNYKLTVNGTLSGNNIVLKGSKAASVDYAGSGTTTLSFDQTTDGDVNNPTSGSNALKELSVSGGGTLTLANKVNLFEKLNVGSGTFNTGDSLVLRSIAGTNGNNTAYVDPVGGTINGQVRVERYVHAQSRGWRAITSPVTYAGLQSAGTVKENWQNSWGLSGNYGTRITGPSATNGLDDVSPGASLMKYNSTTGAWNNITNTTTETIAGTSGNADNISFFLFVRGDRTVTPNGYNPLNFQPTTIPARGKLQTGTQVFNYTGTANKAWLVGNPYACPVDMSTITFSSNIPDFVYVWDPNRPSSYSDVTGSYVTVDRTAWEAGPTAGGTTKYFQTGQCFFVVPTSASGVSITFNESNKSGGNQNNQTSGTGNGLSDIFNVKLNYVKADGSKAEIDGIRAKFGSGYSTAVTAEDSYKWTTSGVENMSLLRKGNALSIEARPYITGTDSLFFNITNLSVGANYEFKVNPVNFDASVSSCKLVDKFLNTETPISLNSTTLVSFNVSSVAGSNAANRFYVVFNATGNLPTSNSLTVKAYKQNNSVKIDWEAIAENNIKTYTVEKSTDANSFAKLSEATAKNGNTNNAYSIVDNNPVIGVNYYRIQSTQSNNNKVYSTIVRVEMSDKGVKSITVYPNPVKGNVIGVQMNNLEPGKYTAKLFNVAGQEIWTNVITHNGNGSISLQLKNALSSGTYELQFIDTKGNSYKQSVLVVE